MNPVRKFISSRLLIVRGYKYTIKTIHNQLFIVNSEATIQINLSFCHLFLYMFSYSCAYTFVVLFVSFAIFRTVSKVKKKEILVRSCALLNLFLINLSFLYVFKMITVISKPLIFLSLPHTHLSTQILVSAHGYFFLLTHPFFRILFPIKRGSLSDFEKHKVP